jgi:hypothetical protein
MSKFSGFLVTGLLMISGNGTTAYSLSPVQTIPSSSGISDGKALVGEMTGDGKIDVVVSGYRDQFTLFTNNGTGFTESLIFDCVANEVICITPLAADFTGDGISDIVFNQSSNNNESKLAILKASGNGNFQYMPQAGNDTLSCQAIASGDLNMDGKRDLLALCGPIDFQVRMFRGDGNGNFIFDSVILNYYAPLVIADWNSDGAPDLITLTSTNEGGGDGAKAEIFLNNGAGVFTRFKTTLFAIGAQYVSLAVADFNGDTLLDLAITADIFFPSTKRQIQIYPGTPDGSLSNTQNIETTAAGRNLTAVDLDNSGRSDLLATFFGNNVSYFLNSAGDFAPEVTNPTGWNASNPLGEHSIADINADGIKDVVLYENDVGLNILYGSMQQISISDSSVFEGNSGAKLASFKVSLSTPAVGAGVSFDFSTSSVYSIGSSALEGSDFYVASQTNVLIPAGQSEKTFYVKIIGDKKVERDEIYAVGISNVVGVDKVKKAIGYGRIVNDDAMALQANPSSPVRITQIGLKYPCLALSRRIEKAENSLVANQTNERSKIQSILDAEAMQKHFSCTP